MRTIKTRLEGKSPLLMHAYHGEKAPEPKPSKKTTEWIEKKHKAKWMDAAYHDGNLFYMPAENIEAMITEGLRRERLGRVAAWAVAVLEERVPLLIPNGKGFKPAAGPLESFYRPEHIDLRGVVIKQIRVDACRPKFREWALEFTLTLDETLIKEDSLRLAFERNSLGDFRPRFGRFRVAHFESVD